MPQNTDSDSILPYTEEPWYSRGYAIPNYGDDEKTANSDIWQMVSDLGRRTQQIASTPCALITAPPKPDTLYLIAQMMDGLRVKLNSLTNEDWQPSQKTPNVTPKTREFLIYPLPYFRLASPFLAPLITLSLEAISSIMQADENLYPRRWGPFFRSLVGGAYREIENRIGIELLRLSESAVLAPDWKLDAETIKASYKPSEWYASTDGATPVPTDLLTPTEDTRKKLVRGIGASLIPRVNTDGTAGEATGANQSSGSIGSRALPLPGGTP